MSGLRGFGFVFENGRCRNWYVGADGVKRWVAGNQPVDDGLDSVDCTGVLIGNTDIPVPEYAPTEPKERPPLPIYPRARDLPVIEPRRK